MKRSKPRSKPNAGKMTSLADTATRRPASPTPRRSAALPPELSPRHPPAGVAQNQLVVSPLQGRSGELHLVGAEPRRADRDCSQHSAVDHRRHRLRRDTGEVDGQAAKDHRHRAGRREKEANGRAGPEAPNERGQAAPALVVGPTVAQVGASRGLPQIDATRLELGLRTREPRREVEQHRRLGRAVAAGRAQEGQSHDGDASPAWRRGDLRIGLHCLSRSGMLCEADWQPWHSSPDTIGSRAGPAPAPP